MTAPIWMASPPEIHSAALSAGPGTGPLLESAAAWRLLGTEYAAVADELTALLGAIQSGVWEGPSAEAFVAAHAPYLAWLLQAVAHAGAAAGRHESAAAAYSSALAGMPTLAELAANHAAHGVLVATNFFGVNTIPIAVNEADYLRMWIQAAAVMTGYDAVATAAVTAAPPAEPAPTVLKAQAMSAEATPPQPPQWFVDFGKWLESLAGSPPYPDSSQYPLYQQLLEFFTKIGYNGLADPLAKFFASLQSGSSLLPPPGVPGSWLAWTGNPLSYLNPGNLAYIFSVPLDPGSYIAFTAKVIIDDLLAIAYTALFNPQGLGLVVQLAVVEMVGSTIGNTVQALNYLVTQTVLLPALVSAAAVGTTVLAPAGVLGGLGIGALAHHAALPIPAGPPPPGLGVPLAQPPAPAPAPAPSPAPAAAPPPAPAAAPAPPPAAPTPPTPAGPPAVGMPAPMYMVGGLSAASRRSAGTSARRRKAPEPEHVEEPVPAPVEEPAVKGRRRRVKASMLGRGYEYMDLDQELYGSRTVHRAAVARPTGLTALAGAAWGRTTTVPMMPSSWESDPV